MENIKNEYSLYQPSGDISFENIFNIKKKKHKSNKTITSIFNKLNNQIRKQLLAGGIIVIEANLIEIPNLNGPDFVLKINSLYKINQQNFDNIKLFVDNIYKILNKQNFSNLISKIVKEGIFINIYLADQYYQKTVGQVLSNGDFYGSNNIFKNQKIIIDYSSPNLSKQMTIGHLRTTIIGQSLVNLIEFCNGLTLKWNFLGGWGTPFGKIVYTILYLYNLKISENIYSIDSKYIGRNLLDTFQNDSLDMLNFIYAFYKNINCIDKNDKARHYFYLLQKGYPVMVKFRELLKSVSIIDFQNVYRRLNIKFDTYIAEDFVENQTEKIITELNKTGFLIEENGVKLLKFLKISNPENHNIITYVPIKFKDIININESDLEVFLIQKKDQTSLYATRDIALLKLRLQRLKSNKIFYCVGSEQGLHFNLIFTIAKLLKYVDNVDNTLYHINNGLILLDGVKMASRQGNIYRLAELIDKVKNKISLEIGKSLSDNLKDKLAISAIIFNDLKNDRIKNINFNIDSMTKLNGDSGIYIQYTKVRLNSLINKITHNIGDYKLKKSKSEYTEIEKEILKIISLFPNEILKSCEEYKVHNLAQYLLKLSQKFHSWYSNTSKIINLPIKDQYSKLYFLQVLNTVITKLIKILHIPTIIKM